VPEDIDRDEVLDSLDPEGPVPDSVQERDGEMRVLFFLYLVARGVDRDQAMESAMESRVATRRNFMGQWTDDDSPFTEEEMREMRRQMASLGLIGKSDD
jgi:exopolysaccharide biosynthesis protein